MTKANPVRILPSLLFLAAGLLLGVPEAARAAAEEPASASGPVRVATLVPFAEDALERLPKEEVIVVAAVRRSMTEKRGGDVADLGSPHSPSFEMLAASRPNLIVADRAMHSALAPKLAGVGTVVMVDSSSVDSTFASLTEIGAKVGAPDAMQKQVDEARKSLETERSPATIPTLALFGTPGSFLAITERTWLGDLLDQMNLQNLGGGRKGREQHPGYVQLSDEVVSQMRPELILVVAHGDPQAIRGALAQRMDEGGPWRALSTSAARGVHVLDAGRFAANPGLRLPDVARQLRTLANGEASEAGEGSGT